MAKTSRMRVLGLLAVGVAWGCGGTVVDGDSDGSESDSTGSSDGFGGDFSDGFVDSGGSGGSGASDGSGATTASAGGAPTTRGNDSGTTRGTTTRGDTSSGTTTRGDTTNGDTTRGDTTRGDTSSGGTTSGQSASASATSSNSGSSVSNGAGGMIGTTASATASSTVSTSGNGGFGGDTGSSTATFTTAVTSTTGSPDPELDDFPYLDGCVDTYWSVGSTSCNLDFTCSDHSRYSSCWDAGNGEFSCECYDNYTWTSYWLAGADAGEACAYTASACVAGSDAEHGDSVCTPSYLYQGPTYCNANATCRTSFDIEGADVAKTGTNYVNCEEREDSWFCNCSTLEASLTLTLSLEDGSAAMCVDALDWCAGEIMREGPRTCSPNSQNASTNSCYANLVCTQDAVVGGAPATLNESFALTCEHAESGTWVCDCPGTGSFEVEAETAWDACTLGATHCEPE